MAVSAVSRWGKKKVAGFTALMSATHRKCGRSEDLGRSCEPPHASEVATIRAQLERCQVGQCCIHAVTLVHEATEFTGQSGRRD